MMETEKMMKQNNMEKFTEQYVEALYYHKIYSPMACWK